MTIYMKVTNDEYELPIALADSVSILARKLEINPCVIHRAMKQAEEKGYKSSYIKVEIDDWEDEDV